MTTRSQFVAPLAIISLAALAVACTDGPAATTSACAGLPTAPLNQRVDLARPSFSNPTSVTNPLFPVSALSRVLLMGFSDGIPFRVETTLMPSTRQIRVDGRMVEVLESQYVAWLGRTLHEVATDWYAQDDAGAVWYLGEDVFNYESGVIADIDGTWLAGREGPAAMIMAANPQVGNVWRPENVCEVVFEEVAVTDIGVTVDGPRGPVTGAIVTNELHMDGTYEDKIFAPGYGEFSTGSGANLEAVALAVPADALAGAMPAALSALSNGSRSIFDAAQVSDWSTVATTVTAMAAAWNSFQGGSVPPTLRAHMITALAALDAAVLAQDVPGSRQASVDVGLATLDLQLRHRPVSAIDLDLLDVWARQLLVDAAAGSSAAVLSDVASLKWIRDRLALDVGAEPELRALDASLAALRASADRRDLRATVDVAIRTRAVLARTSRWR